MNCDNLERVATLTKSGIEIDDHRGLKCVTWEENKQTKNKQSRKDSGINSSTERIDGLYEVIQRVRSRFKTDVKIFI